MPSRSPRRSAKPRPEPPAPSAGSEAATERLVTVAQMRELDRRTIEAGTPGEVLMERAGRAVAEEIRRRFAARCRRGLLVVAGRGNNGGDGFVVARLLKRRGIRVGVVCLAPLERVAGDARLNLERWRRLRGRVVEAVGDDAAAVLEGELSRVGVVVDAIFGTGLRAEVAGPAAQAIEAINAARPRRDLAVVAVDLPSGLDGDRGEPWGLAVRATLTVTLGARKVGLVLPAARPFVGELACRDIGLDPAAFAALGERIEEGSAATMAPLVPRRAATAHKGTNGHLLVVAGSRGKTGAAILAGLGGIRGGAGLTTVACPEEALDLVAAGAPELMTDPIRGVSVKEWRGRLAGKAACVVGPGLGAAPPAARLVRWLVTRAELPLVLDADGLNAVASVPDLLAGARGALVLTPHPGEMARLLGETPAAVQSGRIERALGLARRVRAVVALKGSGTVVASPDGRVTVNTSGGPLLGTGGTGDVLAGLIGGLAAQGLDAYDAARLGVFLHGRAADRLAADLGDAGLRASELADELPRARRELTSV